ncbi:MAG: T9SS type A sorting domain-containing protein [candidate division WOR-3 bacterium]|nr:T9SS type A sorting domain-containing protein [candidate division WOR-3 bacterium]
MRDRMMLLLLVLALPALAQWQTDQRLTNDAHESYTTNNNAWAVAANGNTVHVVWFDNRSGSFQIWYKRSTDAGATWSVDAPLTTTAVYALFPAVAVSGNTVHVIWQDRYDYHGEIHHLRSTNAGVNWGSVTTLSNVDNKLSETPSVAASGNDVWVVWDDSVSAGNYTISCKHSTDAGATWGNIMTVSTGYRSYYPSVAASGSYVHVVWQDNRDNSGRFAIYYDRYDGSQWKGNTNLSTKGAYYSLGPCVAAGIYGTYTYVNVLWSDNRDGSWNIRRKNSTNSGGSWNSDQAVTTNTSSAYFELPSLVASGSNFYSVWAGDSASTGNFEIHYASYTDSFAPHARLTNAAGCSEYASIARAGDVLHVVWQDDRAGNYEIYYKHGSTATLGWSTLTTAPRTFGAYSWLAYERSVNKIYAYFDPSGDDFYSYKLALGSWSSSIVLPAEAGAGSCGCSDGLNDYAYAVVGGGQLFYKYGSGTWGSRANVRSAVTYGGACVFTSGAATPKVYALTGGTGGTGGACKFYAYSPVPDSWSSALATPPGTNAWDAGSWLAYDSVHNMIYAFKSPSNHFYKYDVSTDAWNATELASMPAGTAPGAGGCATVLGGQLFALKGNSTTEFYSYSIADDAWTSLGALGSAPANVVAGSGITTDGTFLYAEFAGSTTRVYKYTPVMFSSKPTLPDNVVARNYVCDKSFAIAPNPLASGFATLRYNLPKSGAARLNVYNVSGQSVLSRTLSVGREASSVTLDLRHLSNGVYMAKLTSSGFAGTQKLVVRR